MPGKDKGDAAMATKKDIKEMGIDRGYGIASWIELPEVGQKVNKDIDWLGLGDKIETAEAAQEYFFLLAHESESNSRQYSPFEFTAQELNDMEDKKPYDVWSVFEDGINLGVARNWKERSKGYYSKKEGGRNGRI